VEKWGVDPSRIFDSRSYSWFEDVMRATEGQGVDIVFNSLAGKHQKLGMEALRTGGRFCEIGKIDVYRYAHACLIF
jgi:NADPH:quinone reductase-like Zn-dependent oxidoreductase